MANTPVVKTDGAKGVSVYQWLGLNNADTPDPLELGGPWPLGACVQFRGTFGGIVTLQGSNDGVTYFTLKDITGTAISTNAAAMFEFSASCRYIKPVPAAGVTLTDAFLCARG